MNEKEAGAFLRLRAVNIVCAGSYTLHRCHSTLRIRFEHERPAQMMAIDGI